MRYEILDAEGNVINTIIADEAFMAANYANYRQVAEPAAPQSWLIKVSAWYDRFDWCCETPKQIALLADSDPVCRALVKMSDARINEGINLASPRLPALLSELVSANKITQAEADAIRTTTPKAEELFK